MPDDRPVSPGEWLRKEASANKDDYDGCSLGSAAVLVAASRLERALSTPAGPRDDPSWTLRRGHRVANGREFTTVISGEDADRPTIEVESIERAAYWHARWYKAALSAARPSSPEEPNEIAALREEIAYLSDMFPGGRPFPRTPAEAQRLETAKRLLAGRD